MKYRINYCVICHQGKIRTVNQDNFWCCNQYLDLDNRGLSEPIRGSMITQSFPVFAVFDGMGGEEKGEIASYIASETFNKHYSPLNIQDENEFLTTICRKINHAICKYARENHIKTMGTTGAYVLFSKEDVFICNIGDSPIFYYDGEKLTQISTDHIQPTFMNSKPPLTQFLGIPESEFVIQPYIAKGSYKVGDKYLLCSDGLTDMVDLDEIEKIISAKQTNVEIANNLVEQALKNGGKDNITIILCEIHKEKIFRFFKKGNKI